MAPLTRRQKKALAAAPRTPVIDPNDRISNLPPEIQAHILSFLPAQDAVRTCVLARTWRERQVWKFTRRLLITANKSAEEVREFVDRLLRVRLNGLEGACLEASEIRFYPLAEGEDSLGYDYYQKEDPTDYDGAYDNLGRWIVGVLDCQIKMLRVDICVLGGMETYLQMSNGWPLVSRNLTRLELTGVWFVCRCINLDGCPALAHLEINECCLRDVRKMISLSLKHLIIRSCDSHDDQKRFQICVPRLVSLLLHANSYLRTPLLERMPELVYATVCIDSYDDSCDCDDPMTCYHVTRASDTSDVDSDSSDDEEGTGDFAGQNTTKSVVLEGLAQARDLVLISNDPTYIFRRDLRWCPTFFNLKTLLLIDEYRREPPDCSVLECMLEHAPHLEKLTVTLKKVPAWEGKYTVEIKGYPDAKGKSTKISQHLQIVEINCEDVNGIFLSVLNLLGTLNICFETRVTKK